MLKVLRYHSSLMLVLVLVLLLAFHLHISSRSQSSSSFANCMLSLPARAAHAAADGWPLLLPLLPSTAGTLGVTDVDAM
jgi:hypothetical protein